MYETAWSGHEVCRITPVNTYSISEHCFSSLLLFIFAPEQEDSSFTENLNLFFGGSGIVFSPIVLVFVLIEVIFKKLYALFCLFY